MLRRFLVWLLLLTVLLAPAAVVLAGDDVYVNGYSRRDGTYVQPHMRSAPDSSYNNNWSTYPNVNPYTGQQGTKAPRLYDNDSGSSYGSGSLFGTQGKS